jgi:hypothetical protein
VHLLPKNLQKQANLLWRKRNENKKPFTDKDFDRWYQVQYGKCAICGKDESSFKRKLAVDHNHKTGIVRGLLCFKCNKGLGHFDEKPELFLKIIKYLQENM